MLSAMFIAFSTYSRIPVPQAQWTDENRRYAMCFFPMIGAVIGAAEALWLALCGAMCFGPMLRGAFGAAIPLMITGGIHMDGFMDTLDALASWQPPERRLEILKDSHTGAFAVMGCALYLLLFSAVLSEAAASDGAAIACVFVLSRAMSAVALTLLRRAKREGMLSGFAAIARRRAVVLSGGAYALAAAAVLLGRMGVAALLPLAAAGLCLAAYRRMAYRQFGGITGDLAGWFVQVTELACVAAVVLGGRIG